MSRRIMQRIRDTLTPRLLVILAVVAMVVVTFGALQLNGCQLRRTEGALDRSVSSDLQGQGDMSGLEAVRAAQEANATQRAADAAADNEARNDPTARNQLSEATRARIAAADKRLCAKANCN
jgi:hypothetical protein